MTHKRTSLRIPRGYLDAIEVSCKGRVGRLSRNTWILEAISEKLDRDKPSNQELPLKLKFYEFFAGGGMARVGLGQEWECLFANDIEEKKAKSYRANWPDIEFKLADVADLTIDDIPPGGDLAWGSFPCQDLSLAGDGAGLEGKRSGTFWPFWQLMRDLKRKSREPKLIVLENVCGAITSHAGRDFAAIARALNTGGYRFGPLVMDAKHFLPQSRPRLFIVAVRKGTAIPKSIRGVGPDANWHSRQLNNAYSLLPRTLKKAWLWWRIPAPPTRKCSLMDIIEDQPTGVAWHDWRETSYILSLMSSINKAKVEEAQKLNTKLVGTVYRRSRPNGKGRRVQRAEVRFDNISGCLRTPVGGSSRQTILVVNGERLRSRLLSPREAARLMGLSDDYVLPQRYNEAYHLVGDGLAVPVVRFLANHVLEPILKHQSRFNRKAA